MDQNKAVVTVAGMVFIFFMTLIMLVNLVPENLHCESYEIFNDEKSIQFRDCSYTISGLVKIDVLVDVEK